MKRIKLSDLAAEKIKEMIDNKEYDSNGYLVSEGELALQIDVSRATIREAVKSLEVRGLVRRIHGKGIKVSDDTTEVLRRSLEDMISCEADTLNELLEVRMMIEPKGAEFAALRHSVEDLECLRKQVEFMEQSDSMNKEYYLADLAFHVGLAKASNNRIYASFIEAYTATLQQLIIESSNVEKPIEKNFHFHRNIYEAVKARDGAAAYCAMLNHLEATFENKSQA